MSLPKQDYKIRGMYAKIASQSAKKAKGKMNDPHSTVHIVQFFYKSLGVLIYEYNELFYDLKNAMKL